eukprot:6148948-Amphidinium_carterae.1
MSCNKVVCGSMISLEFNTCPRCCQGHRPSACFMLCCWARRIVLVSRRHPLGDTVPHSDPSTLSMSSKLFVIAVNSRLKRSAIEPVA